MDEECLGGRKNGSAEKSGRIESGKCGCTHMALESSFFWKPEISLVDASKGRVEIGCHSND